MHIKNKSVIITLAGKIQKNINLPVIIYSHITAQTLNLTNLPFCIKKMKDKSSQTLKCRRTWPKFEERQYKIVRYIYFINFIKRKLNTYIVLLH